MLYLHLLWENIRAFYRMEPALINSAIASVVVIAANRILGLDLSTGEVAAVVATILGGGVATRRKVTAPANVVPPEMDVGDSGSVTVRRGESNG